MGTFFPQKICPPFIPTCKQSHSFPPRTFTFIITQHPRLAKIIRFFFYARYISPEEAHSRHGFCPQSLWYPDR